MIKAIILDVDGVIIGGKQGFNWPDPHPEIIQALRSLRQRGIFISLCTGKGTFAIKKIVESAHLNNVHIGDGGAVVVDFLNHQVITQHLIDTKTVVEIIRLFHKLNTYLELYTLYGYYIQKDQVCQITETHTKILDQKPILVDSLTHTSNKLHVVKVMPVAKDLNDKEKLINAFSKYSTDLPFQWGFHPTAAPLQFGIITAPNISKMQAAQTIANTIGIPFANILGVGDGLTDWEFIKLCRYAGVMGNASNELKEMVRANKPENYFFGSGVDENGLLNIFRHFHLT